MNNQIIEVGGGRFELVRFHPDDFEPGTESLIYALRPNKGN